MTKRDTLTALAFAVASALIRIPFRSTKLFHGDSYGLAMGALFTWTAHPPGFIGFCALVRFVNYLAGDVTTSFIIVSIGTTAIATALVFILGRTMFGFAEGVIAALFYATSLDVSYFSEVALTYAAEGCFATAAGLTSWLAISRHSERWLVVHSIVLGVGGSVRQTTLAFLFPLWLYTMWKATPRWRARVLGALALVIVVFGWSIPNARNLRRYWDKRDDVSYLRSVYDLQVRMEQYYDSSKFGAVTYEESVRRFHWPLAELAVGAWNAIDPPSANAPPEVKRASAIGALRMIRYQTLKLIAYTLLACGLWIVFVIAGLRRLGRERAIFLALWIVPAFLFFALNHFGAWGYLLIFLGALAVIAAHGSPRGFAIVAIICAIHFGVFVFMRPLPDRSERATLMNIAVLQYGAPAIRMSYARARSSAFSEDPRELPVDCVTEECLERNIPLDYNLPPGTKPMRTLFR